MNKILKRGLLVGSIAAVAYQGFRVYRLIKPLNRLEKELKIWLQEKYGEEPKLNCILSATIFIHIAIIAKFSAETLARHEDIEANIKAYIAENYPELNIPNLKVRTVDASLNKADLIRQCNPKLYKVFGKLIEKKLHSRQQAPEFQEDK